MKQTINAISALFIIVVWPTSIFAQDILDGYVLATPLKSYEIQLIDTDGNFYKTTTTDYAAVNGPYLLDDGTVLKGGKNIEVGDRWEQSTSGVHGIIEQVSFDDGVVWSFAMSNDTMVLHHDVTPMPNGNILMMAYRMYTDDWLTANGRSTSYIGRTDGLWGETIMEVNPTTNEIVWQWDAMDHVCQNLYSDKANYVSNLLDAPGKIDLNIVRLGGNKVDWLHFNGMDYNEDLDQIVLSCLGTSEIYFIDHSTTTAEAKTSTGGNRGKGGDILYRLGNPVQYNGSGTRTFYEQHNVHWIDEGKPGAGNIMVFNNRNVDAFDNGFTPVYEISFPGLTTGDYTFTEGVGFADYTIEWSYNADASTGFYSEHMGSAQRLENGNTLITNAVAGYTMEVTTDGTELWRHQDASFPKVRELFSARKYPADHPAFMDLSVSTEEVLGNANVWYSNGNLYVNDDALLEFDECQIFSVNGALVGGFSLHNENSIPLSLPASGLYTANLTGSAEPKSFKFIFNK